MLRARFSIVCFALVACSKPAAEKEAAGVPSAAGPAGRPPAASAHAPATAEPTALLAVGAPAPAIVAEAHTGEQVKLAELRGKPVVVYFYPKDDTPGCTVEAQEIRDVYTDLRGTGAVVLGVSTQDNESHRAFANKHELPFLLLPDTDHAIARAFGVPLRNGKAKRVTFLIDSTGKVAKVWPDVDPRGHAAELVQAVRALG